MILLAVGILCAVITALFFSTLTYALRDFSRSKLADALARAKRSEWINSIIDHRDELTLITGMGRLLANTCILLGALRLFHHPDRPLGLQYLYAGLLAIPLSGVFSLMIPLALAEYAGESALAISVRLLNALRIFFKPLVTLMRWTDRLVRRITGATGEPEAEQIEKDILSVVQEGEKEGVVDRQERRMIESVIEFRDTTSDQTMTSRPEIVAIELGATLDEVKHTIEASGHSRLPVYDGTLDHIVGILYARDLLKHLGTTQPFDMRTAMRPAVFVPESKPLRDLLMEFRLQKVHIAIVLDEYGGTAGLVTIEDILEELVGEISDEHEALEPAMLKRVDDRTHEADARVYVDEINKQLKLALPTDVGYDTIGGFVSNAVGRIPQKGTVVEQHGARFTVLEAEPHRIRRLKIELLPQTAGIAERI